MPFDFDYNRFNQDSSIPSVFENLISPGAHHHYPPSPELSVAAFRETRPKSSHGPTAAKSNNTQGEVSNPTKIGCGQLLLRLSGSVVLGSLFGVLAVESIQTGGPPWKTLIYGAFCLLNACTAVLTTREFFGDGSGK